MIDIQESVLLTCVRESVAFTDCYTYVIKQKIEHNQHSRSFFHLPSYTT